MPRDPYAEAIMALEMASQHVIDVRLSPVQCRALLEKLTANNPTPDKKGKC